MSAVEAVESVAAAESAASTFLPRVISLFSGAGGLDIGLEVARWRVLAQVEMDGPCVETLKRNRTDDGTPRADVIPKRVEDVSPAELRAKYGLKKGELELLAGGPPCQPFTTHGRRRALHDRRAESAFPAYLKYVEEFEPQALLMENVDGLLSAALQHRPLEKRGKDAPELTEEEMKGSFLRWLVSELVELGYAVSWGVAEAADFGVPQMRQRAILIGVKGTEPCYMPTPTHGPEGEHPYRTVRETLREVRGPSPVQPLSERKTAVYAHIPAGGNWRDLPPEMQKETMGQAYFATGGKSGWWRRLSWDAPAPTILGMPDHSSTALIHPDEVRCLSVAECAALQSFPPGTVFRGKPRTQYQQIGNAVPPRLGEALGAHIRAFLDGKRHPDPPRPDWRKTSSNRRIGTHGWARKKAGQPHFHLHVRLRPDHVWAVMPGVDVPQS